MADMTARDRLQPSLFDRLNDELASDVVQLQEDRRALQPLLDDAQSQALATLLTEEQLDRRPPSADRLAAFASLNEAARPLLDRIIRFEMSRRHQVRRTVTLTAQELRTAVLRDLQNLLNTTAAEADLNRDGSTFDSWPGVQASVVNYGIPALAGRIQTTDDVLVLAQQIERAIERFEPRVRQVHVSVADHDAARDPALSSPLELIIEGELWGYPIAEQFRVHTILDLDAGHAEVVGSERIA